MKKRFVTIIVTAALSCALMPLVAYADDAGLAAGTAPLGQGASTQQSIDSVDAGSQLTTQVKKYNAKATKKMRNAYKSVLTKARLGKSWFNKTYRYASSRPYFSWYSMYTMRDVNKDGIPELFVNAGSCSADTTWYVFTIKSGKAKYLGKIGDGYTSLYSGKGKAIYGSGFHMGVAKVYIGKMSGGKLKVKMPVVDTAELKGYPKMNKYMKRHKMKVLTNYSTTDYFAIDRAKVWR